MGGVIVSDKVLEIKGLQKKINNKLIVKSVTLDVHSSEVFGFLGPNGAGKTTTIRMITGLIKATAGTVKICGYNIKNDFARAMADTGCIIESPDLYNYMSANENLKHFANMYNSSGLNKLITKKRIQEVVDLVGLNNRINDLVEEYSTGMRQRLGLAQAILSKPKLLILDEPVNGLDPEGIREFRILIRLLAEQEKMAVFVSSHLLAEVQLMCDTVGFIKAGELQHTISIRDLASSVKTVWTVNDAQEAYRLLSEYWEEELTNIEVINKITFAACVKDELVADVNRSLIKAGIDVFTVCKQQKSLEDEFLERMHTDVAITRKRNN